MCRCWGSPDRFISVGRIRFTCIFAALANGLLYLLLANEAPKLYTKCEMLFFGILFWTISASLLYRYGPSWEDAPESMNDSRVLSILLPCAASLNARVAMYSYEEDSDLAFAKPMPWWFLLWCCMTGAMLLTVVQGLPQFEKRLFRDFTREGFPYVEWSAIVGCSTLLAAATVQHWHVQSNKLECYVCDCGQTLMMLVSALTNESLVMLHTDDSSGVRCLMRFLLLQMFLGNFLYSAWTWDTEDYIFLGAAVVQCGLLCGHLRHQDPQGSPVSFASSLPTSSRYLDRVEERPSCCKSFFALFETFRSRHALAMLNATFNLVTFIASRATVLNTFREGEEINCQGMSDEQKTRMCPTLQRGTHVLSGAIIVAAVACVVHACAIAADGNNVWQIDGSFRWGSLLKASLLWLKIVILFYTRPKTGNVNAVSGLITACVAVSLFVFNMLSMKPILKSGWAGTGSLRTKSYRIGALMVACIDAVLILFIACGLAHVDAFVNTIQDVGVDKMLFLPCTYLFPIFGLCNELSQAARDHIQLPSGVYVMALQCAFTIPLQVLVNIVLPATTMRSHQFWVVHWPVWVTALTTVAIVSGSLFIMHATASRAVARGQGAVSLQPVT